ncbi:hypothetical protein ACFFTN_12620 [Aminobacter aganoensis]|uniref:DUF4149 domain-containing protein n=1 Tax=Aminobacter aganoensis TaxID=83264 RepID=A0A7X0F9Y1_9HYPH|nr:hypothetical protein [Aminobacter aganoensis]MBB6355848.1 hypothetical protein [Aminobacter aganoensis]
MRRGVGDKLSDRALVLFATFWAGMLAGVSFLATPVKFQAASLSLPVALDVGRVTFWTFSRVEWGLAAVLVATSLFPVGSRLTKTCVVIVAAIVTAQALWLLPALNLRVEAVIAGSPYPPSYHHMLYAVAETAKILLLCLVATIALYRPGRIVRPAGE